VTASNLRTLTAVAAVPAALVVILHLALRWGDQPDLAARRNLAFTHGIALAVVLAGALIAGRWAHALEHGVRHPIADAVGVGGTIAVLAHLASAWRDDANPADQLAVTAGHLLLLAVVTGVVLLVRHAEDRRRAA
jgi:peptidoglycan/LPS O-acetylase OafA/YrhL